MFQLSLRSSSRYVRISCRQAARAAKLERFREFPCLQPAIRSLASEARVSKMGRPEIYVVSRFPNLAEHLREAVKGRADVVEIIAKFTVHDDCPKIKPEVVKRLQSVEILITDTYILKDILYQLPKMELVQVTSAGVEKLIPNIDRSAPVPQYTIVRASCLGVLMAEYVVAGIINFERGLYRYFELQKTRNWDDLISLNFRTLSDLRVAILGAGVIGEEIAKSLVQFGATVNGFARRSRSSEELHCSSFQIISPDLSSLLEDCHYLVNALPSTPSTIGILNGDVLRRCKNSPVFINIGRGNVISEGCLLNALKEKWISGAMLDVFEVEPLPTSSPLWATQDVIVTPHMSGPFRPQEVVKSFMINFEKFLAGQPLIHKFSFESGY
ncbi:glyoxylate/hydroxypyruvate reductase A-like [Dermacentor andersoni]|uniref:glyoxylate/hydroxypyruvate reductase A-like n=1 Tax=Dermacentor andersoni TaxID=34620 RepID=UPI002416FF78|nr:glyoxylate/hydroxypyruvate reductase A-like [Dermacentor andersoni]